MNLGRRVSLKETDVRRVSVIHLRPFISLPYLTPLCSWAAKDLLSAWYISARRTRWEQRLQRLFRSEVEIRRPCIWSTEKERLRSQFLSKVNAIYSATEDVEGISPFPVAIIEIA